MAEPYDITAEIRDDVRALRIEFRDGLQRIEDTRVHKDVFAGLVDRVDDLEGHATWMGRLVASSIIVAVLSIVIAAPVNIGG